MEKKTIFASEDNEVTIVCPHCGLSRDTSVSKFKGKKNQLVITCRCKKKFAVDIDFRQDFRQPLTLPATYQILSGSQKELTDTFIDDISLSGLRLRLSGDPVSVGDRLEVVFRFRNKPHKTIRKGAIVTNIKDGFAGCQFTEGQDFLEDISLFLMRSLV